MRTTSVVTPSAILASSHEANARDSMTFEPCLDTHGISDSAASRFAGGSESGLWRKKRVAREGRLERECVAYRSAKRAAASAIGRTSSAPPEERAREKASVRRRKHARARKRERGGRGGGGKQGGRQARKEGDLAPQPTCP